MKEESVAARVAVVALSCGGHAQTEKGPKRTDKRLKKPEEGESGPFGRRIDDRWIVFGDQILDLEFCWGSRHTSQADDGRRLSRSVTGLPDFGLRSIAAGSSGPRTKKETAPVPSAKLASGSCREYHSL